MDTTITGGQKFDTRALTAQEGRLLRAGELSAYDVDGRIIRRQRREEGWRISDIS